MPHFADAAVQKTQGVRGKTTRRRSTKTVRGSEGAWIAMMKEELASRPAGWLVKYETIFDARRWETAPTVKASVSRRYDTQEEADTAAAAFVVGEATRFKNHNFSGFYSRVWVEKEVKS